MIKVLIADDDAIIREGLKLILGSAADLEVVGEAADGVDVVEKCRLLRSDVALMDIRMPRRDGIEAAETILSENLGAPLLLTTFDEEELILRALRAGINGYILKNSPAEQIINAVRIIAGGGTVFQADILEYVRSRLVRSGGSEVFAILSTRETEIVRLISDGLTNQEIADRLYISNGTVRNHISAILEKTGLRHRTEIAVVWLKG